MTMPNCQKPNQRSAQDVDNDVIGLAMEAATNAAALVIQNHLGVTDGGFAAEWWSEADRVHHGEMLALARVLRLYMRDEKQAQINDDGAEGALTYALAALERDPGPIPEKAKASADMLRSILAQRGCEGFANMEDVVGPDGSVSIKPEGAKRLVDLIDVIVRG